MAQNNNSGIKLPQVPSKATSNKPLVDIEVVQRPDGQGSLFYSPIDHSEAKADSFEEHWTPMGSYKTRESHSRTELTTSLGYEYRGLNIGGSSETIEGSKESYVRDTRKTTTEGDVAIETGRNQHIVVAGLETQVKKLGAVVSTVGSSDAPTYDLHEGDRIQRTTGDVHKAVENDEVKVVGGNKILMVKDGDYAAHVQSGGWDTKVTKKTKLFSGTDLLIQSATKITLRVGTSSIVITPNNIEIIAQNSSGIIDLNPGGSGSGTGDPSETV